MRVDARRLALSAAFASLYAVLVVALAPISFYAAQVRVADALLPLSMLFGWPAILGLSIGCFVGNLFGLPGLAGLIDATLGSLANFVGCALAYYVSRSLKHPLRFLAGSIVIVAVITLVVGSYLSPLLGLPLWVCISGVFIGSVVSVVLLGYLLLLAVRASGMLNRYWVE